MSIVSSKEEDVQFYSEWESSSILQSGEVTLTVPATTSSWTTVVEYDGIGYPTNIITAVKYNDRWYLGEKLYEYIYTSGVYSFTIRTDGNKLQIMNLTGSSLTLDIRYYIYSNKISE